MSNQLTDENILAALGGVKDPEIGRDLVSLGMVKNIAIDGSVVDLTVELTTPACPLKATIENDIGEALTGLGASLVRVDWASNVKRSFGGPAADLIPGVRNTIAVASGKGGVGKSTVAVNLAVSLARDGAQVGLLDADITGPNVPLMMGTQGSHVTGTSGRPNPVSAHGVKMMSIQYFLDPNQPVIWRGPLIHSAINQFLRDVEWGDLDYLVIDLPPGTGDAALSLSQIIPLTGAVIVTTPQEVSLLDARKAVGMFNKVNVRTLGVIENMSGFVCPALRQRARHLRVGRRREALARARARGAGPHPDRARRARRRRCRRTDHLDPVSGRRRLRRRGRAARGRPHRCRQGQRTRRSHGNRHRSGLNHPQLSMTTPGSGSEVPLLALLSGDCRR